MIEVCIARPLSHSRARGHVLVQLGFNGEWRNVQYYFHTNHNGSEGQSKNKKRAPKKKPQESRVSKNPPRQTRLPKHQLEKSSFRKPRLENNRLENPGLKKGRHEKPRSQHKKKKNNSKKRSPKIPRVRDFMWSGASMGSVGRLSRHQTRIHGFFRDWVFLVTLSFVATVFRDGFTVIGVFEPVFYRDRSSPRRFFQTEVVPGVVGVRGGGFRNFLFSRRFFSGGRGCFWRPGFFGTFFFFLTILPAGSTEMNEVVDFLFAWTTALCGSQPAVRPRHPCTGADCDGRSGTRLARSIA